MRDGGKSHHAISVETARESRRDVAAALLSEAPIPIGYLQAA